MDNPTDLLLTHFNRQSQTLPSSLLYAIPLGSSQHLELSSNPCYVEQI